MEESRGRVRSRLGDVRRLYLVRFTPSHEFSPFRLANDGTKFFFKTNKDAPQYKVVTIDLADEQLAIQTIIPEDNNAFLDDIKAVNGDTFVVVYKRNVRRSPDRSSPLGRNIMSFR